MSLGRLDPRVTPARADVAARSLEGRVGAARFVEGRAMQVTAPSAALRRDPRPDAELGTEALRGERVRVFDEREGWAWGQLEADGYVGYLPAAALGEAGAGGPTHRIAALFSFVFPGTDIKLPPLATLPFGARVSVRDSRGEFVRVDDGFLWARHLAPVEAFETDPVAVAERFLGVPYLWGGKTAAGIDCSGLVQLALQAAGRRAPRDSDHQEQALGAPVGAGQPLRRGDLVFWSGHVGLMRDRGTLLHANGHAMAVTSEPLREVVARFESHGGGAPTSFRRLP